MEKSSKTKNKVAETKIDPDTGLPIDILKKEIERGVLSGAVDMSLDELKDNIKSEARQQLK